MDYMDWCKNMVKNKKVQELIEQKVKMLVELHFDEKNEYAIEKFIKSFGEPIKYLEDILETQRGLHSDQIEKNMIYISTHQKETIEKMNEIEKILISETERQFRHFNIFLANVKG